MANITWDKDDLQNNRDDAGTTADTIGDHSGDLQQGYPLGSLTDGLIAYYPFDGDVKDHALDNNGTDNTSAGYVNGKVGSKAKDFNGEDDYVTASASGLSISHDKTISYWVNLDDSMDSVHVQDNQASDDRFNAQLYSSQIEGYIWDGSSWYGDSYSFSTTGAWAFVVHVWRADSSTVTTYVNASTDSSTPSSSHLSNSTSTLDFGRNSNGSRYADCQIDDVRIYDRALSKPEIQALYNRTKTQKITDQDRLTAGLVGHWPLNEDTTSKAYDLSGRGNDATNVTGTTVTTGLGGSKARSFDGSDDYVEMSQFSGKVRTISLWFNPSQKFTGDESRDVLLSDSAARPTVFLGDWAGATSGEVLGIGGSNGNIHISDKVNNDWHHAAFVWNDSISDYEIYLDGTKRATNKHNTSPSLTSNWTLNVGRGNSTEYGESTQADVRIYNRALSRSEIKALAQQGGIDTS